MSPESFSMPGNTPEPEKTPELKKPEEGKEQSPVTPEQRGEKFNEILLNVAAEMGYATREEGGKNVLEKNGQTITMRHVFFENTGQTVFQPSIEYKDNPLIRPAALSFYHPDGLNEKEVKKTFKKQLEIYAKRFDHKDNRMDLFPDHTFFNQALMIIAQERGYSIEKLSQGRRIIFKNDQHTIKMQHLPYKSASGKRISAIEILNNTDEDFAGNGAVSTIEWDAQHMEGTINQEMENLFLKSDSENNEQSEPKVIIPLESEEDAIEVTTDQVIEALKTKGKEDPYAVELWEKWTNQYREKIGRDPDQESQIVKSTMFYILRAKVLVTGGYIEMAIDDLRDTLEIAHQLRLDPLLCDQIEGMIQGLQNESGL